MPADEMLALVNDIKFNGLLHPIILFEGKILDGRHRYEACRNIGIKPKFEQYKGADPVGYSLRANLHRRHLSTAQRAMLAAKVADLKQGERGRGNKSANAVPTHAEAAEILAISPRSVDTASKILDTSPKLAKAVANGEMSLRAAEKKIDERAREKEDVLDETGWRIPDELVELWQRRGEVKALHADLTSIETRLLKYQKEKDPLFEGIHYSAVVSRIQNIQMELRGVIPHAVCSTCQGRGYKKCAHCKGRGFLNKLEWQLVPSEIRSIREKGAKK